MSGDVQMTGWFYLSFASEDSFLGGCIVRAPDDLMAATLEAHRLKINPGGHVVGMPIPEGFLPGSEYRERLLTKAEIGAFWPDAKRLGDIDEDAAAQVRS